MNYSLEMQAEQVDGQWLIDAPWLETPVLGATFHEAYWQALELRARRESRPHNWHVAAPQFTTAQGARVVPPTSD